MKFQTDIIVPARNEEWLGLTIKDVLENTSDACGLIVILDGAWPITPIEPHPRLTMIHNQVSIGQRAAINQAARLSTADYVVKLDAHCRVDKDFDLKLIQHYEPGTVVVPRLFNLHVYDLRCTNCGTQTYQGPMLTHCTHCNQDAKHERVVIWEPRWSRKTDFMKFDESLRFGYWGSFKDRPEAQGDIANTMSLLGACFFMSRKHYWDIDGSDESHGGWGQQGSEISIKAHLYKDGRLRVNKLVWYSHLFRTQPGFGFPYPLSHGQTERARTYSQDFWLNNKWKKASRPLSSMIEQYWPIPGWSQESLDALKAGESGSKQFAPTQVVEQKPAAAEPRKYVQSAKSEASIGIVYYTDNRLDPRIMDAVQRQITKNLNGHQLVSVSLKPLAFGDNVVLGLQRGFLAMAQQILAGLSLLDTDFCFMAEHDILYSDKYFSSFIPPRRDRVYYNENVWRLRTDTGETLFHYHKSLSQMCGDRSMLIDHFRERIARIERGDSSFRMGFEPGTKSIRNGGVDDLRSEVWFAATPNIDIHHGQNCTKLLWEPSEYRNIKFTQGWQKADHVPGWSGKTLGRFNEWLAETVPT